MLFMRIIRYFLGSVRFSADGGFPEKFLNLVAGSGIMLWDIRRRGTAVEAGTLRRSYRKLEPLAARAGVRLTVLRRTGVPYRMKKVTHRHGILAGALIFFAALGFFSSFIWEVDISGNRTTPTAEIVQVLGDLGLRPGAFPLLVNTRLIEQQALLRLPDLSGITINIRGCDAQVEVRERAYPPDIVPENIPCDVKASRTGQVIDLQTFTGQAMIRDGDTIQAGEVLISGVIQDKNGVVHMVHASGVALARTSRDLSVTVSYRGENVTETGRVCRLRTLELFNFQIPLYLRAPKGNFRVSVATQKLSLAGRILPFALRTRVFREIRTEPVTYTREQAAALAAKELADREKTELAGVRILSRSDDPQTADDHYTLIVHYTCEEDIALQEAVQIS